MIVKEEPFRLCEVHGFGFLTVDQIAVKANISVQMIPFVLRLLFCILCQKQKAKDICI